MHGNEPIPAKKKYPHWVTRRGPGVHGTRDGDRLFSSDVLVAEIVENSRGQDNGCVLWVGKVNALSGYGTIIVGERIGNRGKVQSLKRLAHRVVFELICGPTPLVLDHLCRNKRCVNPGHLEPVSVGENSRRGHALTIRAVECKRGHKLTRFNIKWRNSTSSGNQVRECAACARTRGREWHARKVEQRKAGL
jgi:hypothetical protein